MPQTASGARRVTIRDVAALAGVSIGTASKALNGQGKLRAETRARVAEVARQLGFSPNLLARGLLAGRTYTVGLITTDSFGRFSLPVMLGADDRLAIQELVARAERAASRRDVAAYLDCFTDDGVLDGAQGQYRGAAALGQALGPIWEREGRASVHLSADAVVELPSFKAFTANAADRQVAAPDAVRITTEVVDAYGFERAMARA